MGYYEVLNVLKKQLEQIKTKEEYYNKQKELALRTKDIALELDINVRSVYNAIAKMLKANEIECLKGEIDITEKKYILKISEVKEHGDTPIINISMDDNGNIECSNTPMGNQPIQNQPEPTDTAPK